MSKLYSMTKCQQAIRDFTKAKRDKTGNLPPLPSIQPDCPAPIVRNFEGERWLSMARWGMPSPGAVTMGGDVDPGIPTVRNTKSPHWRWWLGVESRCVVPFTSFSGSEKMPDGSRLPVWFALDETRPLAFFAGIWTGWTSVRKPEEGRTRNDIFAFLLTAPNAIVKPVHPRAMPVILRTQAEIETWMTAPPGEALKLQRPLPDTALRIVAKGGREDQ